MLSLSRIGYIKFLSFFYRLLSISHFLYHTSLLNHVRTNSMDVRPRCPMKWVLFKTSNYAKSNVLYLILLQTFSRDLVQFHWCNRNSFTFLKKNWNFCIRKESLKRNEKSWQKNINCIALKIFLTIARWQRKLQPVFLFIVIVIVQIYVALLAGNKIK